MAITYTWKVTSVKVKDEGDNTDAIVQTFWTKTGTDDNGEQGTFSGATPFTSVDVPEGDFVDFADLTEEIILGWIQAVVVDEYENHVNQQIQKQIDQRAIVEKDLPWASI